MVIMRFKYLLVCLITILCGFTLNAQKVYTFKEALDSAKENNPFLQAVKLNVLLSQGDVITAGLRPNPILNNQTLQLASSGHFAPGTKFYEAYNRQVWWQLTKPFQLSHQRENKIETASKVVTVTEKNYLDSQRAVLLDCGGQWLNVWYSKANLNLIQQAKKNIDSLVLTNQVRLKNQVISNSEYTRTELLSEQYQLQLKQAEQDYRNQLLMLQLVTGSKDSVAIDMDDPVISLSTFEQADSIQTTALQYRPDLQAANSAIDVANSNIKLQKSLSKPVPELGLIYNPQNSVPYVGFFGTIELPFFSRNQGEIRKSKIQLEQSQKAFSGLQKQISTEVSTAFKSYQVSKEAVERYSDILQKSQQVLEAVKYAYTKGGTTIIDFLEAQRTWFDTQKLYYDAMFNYRKNYLQLLYSTGQINQL